MKVYTCNMIRLPTSLRQRYILIVTVTMLVAVSVLMSVKFVINNASDLRLKHSRMQLAVANDVNLIHKYINDADRIIDLYLLSPEDEYRLKFFEKLDDVDRLIRKAESDEWVVEKALDKDLHKLGLEVHLYREKISNLMEIRVDRGKMYPVISLAEQGMLRINDTFSTSINYAINEVRVARPFSFNKYEKLIAIRDKWRRLIMAYRIYVINRTASLPKETLPGLLSNINLFIDNIIHDIEHDLLPMLKEDDIGLETEEGIGLIYEQAKKWRKSFLRVKQIAETNEWRRDIPYAIQEVMPASDNVYQRLEQIIRFLNLSASEDLKAQHRASDDISLFLWLLLGSFSIIFILVYFVIYSSLLQPIATLSNNLKDKDINDASPFRPVYSSSEMQDFVHALNDMQQQINVRQNQLEHMAMHDALTRLPNRSLLLDRVNSAISTYNRYRDNFAVILLDLDRFKEVNDTLGHLVGDDILIEVAHRLKTLLRESDTVARLGGDEFAILLLKVDLVSIEEMAQKISEALAEVYKINEHNLYLGASLGIAIYPQHGEDPDSLIQHADVAMYLAKNSNTDYEIYNPEKDTFNINQLALLSDLRDAIKNEELFLEYQPIYNTEGSHINAFECLLRWQHPKFGTVMPDNFIFHAEQTGLIKKITQWVIDEVAKSISILKNYDKDIYLSINVTAWDLQDEALVKYVDDCLIQYKLGYNS
ncbi:MAG: diguanylate cyclase, partial [Thioalkalispiraceae bacterium]